MKNLEWALERSRPIGYTNHYLDLHLRKTQKLLDYGVRFMEVKKTTTLLKVKLTEVNKLDS